MKRALISLALSQLDDDLIAEALHYRAAKRSHAPERKRNVKKPVAYRTGSASRKLLVLALAACLLLALSTAAYAANLWSIREMFRTDRRELPEYAEPWIETHSESAAAADWSARITESLCDSSSVLVTVTVSGGDRWILAPTDESPDRPLWVIGRQGEGTLGEYAEAQGKKLLFVGASLPCDEALGISSQSIRFESISDSEMAILIQADKAESAAALETVCIVTGLEAESQDIRRLEIPFTLAEGRSRALGVFAPEDANAIPGLALGDAVVTETPLGITVSIPMHITDPAVGDALMKLDFDELVTHDGSFGEGGALYTMCEGTVTDTLTARFYDWDKQPVGTVVFRKTQ